MKDRNNVCPYCCRIQCSVANNGLVYTFTGSFIMQTTTTTATFQGRKWPEASSGLTDGFKGQQELPQDSGYDCLYEYQLLFSDCNNGVSTQVQGKLYAKYFLHGEKFLRSLSHQRGYVSRYSEGQHPCMSLSSLRHTSQLDVP